MRYISQELDSWLNLEFLVSIADDIVNLKDFVPKTIELHLPNYEERKSFLLSCVDLIDSDAFQDRQILDQMAAGTTWDEYVGLYDEFFKNHPEFIGLIKDMDAYNEWKREEVPY